MQKVRFKRRLDGFGGFEGAGFGREGTLVRNKPGRWCDEAACDRGGRTPAERVS